MHVILEKIEYLADTVIDVRCSQKVGALYACDWLTPSRRGLGSFHT